MAAECFNDSRLLLLDMKNERKKKKERGEKRARAAQGILDKEAAWAHLSTIRSCPDSSYPAAIAAPPYHRIKQTDRQTDRETVREAQKILLG